MPGVHVPGIAGPNAFGPPIIYPHLLGAPMGAAPAGPAGFGGLASGPVGIGGMPTVMGAAPPGYAYGALPPPQPTGYAHGSVAHGMGWGSWSGVSPEAAESHGALLALYGHGPVPQSQPQVALY